MPGGSRGKGKEIFHGVPRNHAFFLRGNRIRKKERKGGKGLLWLRKDLVNVLEKGGGNDSPAKPAVYGKSEKKKKRRGKEP